MQLFLILSVLATCSLQANGISCYLCESAYESHCGADFEMESYYKYDCGRVPAPRFLEIELEPLNATACMKKIYEEGGVQKIIRSCFFGDVNATATGCKTDPSQTATVQEIACHVCDTENYCNAGAAPQSWQPPALALIALLAYALTRQQSRLHSA